VPGYRLQLSHINQPEIGTSDLPIMNRITGMDVEPGLSIVIRSYNTGPMTLEEVRRFFAEEIHYFANVKNPALVAAFQSVPREKFVGPGPWKIGLTGFVETPDADPRHVYHNLPISLDESRNLNNGQPGALAVWIDALELKTGERVYHLGGGVGYYDAILAEVVGRTGAVLVTEVDTDLAARAQGNLANYANVTVHAVDGSEFDPGDCDAILINAGCTHLDPCWLDRLRDGGRLMVPLTIKTEVPGMASERQANLGAGRMVKVVRHGHSFTAAAHSPIAIFSCTSMRDAESEANLRKAMGKGLIAKLQSVRRDPHQPDETCVLHRNDVCLSAAFSAVKP
jgi:protein-L-isoaspartate(D-aspartate) O-methyltransferase